MSEFIRKLFSADFMPHGFCYRWDPPTLWLNVISDCVIAIAYYAIPILLFQFARRRRDIAFKWIFVAFGMFILACGTTHLMGAVTAWNPVYRLDGVIKAVTALASVATFGMLIPMMPTLVALPSPAQLERINRTLAQEVEDRKAAEEQVRRSNEELEVRVTERTRELAQSESRFRQLADAIPQMVWVAGPTGESQYFNRRWYEYIGDAAGRGWTMLHPDDLEPAQVKWEQSLASGEPYEMEYRVRRHDGVYRWFLVRGTPVYDQQGGIVQWFGTCTDIDDQKRAAEALERTLADLQSEMQRRRELETQLIQAQKMEAVGRLAGGVAHDFNNLLTAILGYNEMLLDEVRDNPQAAEFAEEVLRAAERASGLTNQLLAFSRRQVSQPRVINLNQVVAQMERMLRRIIGEDIVCDLRLDPALRPVRVDPSHMDQVILNLAVNARDAMPAGGRLSIETLNVDIDSEYSAVHLEFQPGPYVLLAISDSGTGMDAGTRAHLFEPFFTTKQAGKGTGLGLSIVYGIVKQNGGQILVYSEPGQGSVFKIYLPAVAAPAEALSAGPSERPARGSETILLVEDEEQVRSLARRILTREGYEVLEAESTDDALRLAAEHPAAIHLLLTDVVMPHMGGQELAGAVRARRPHTRVLYMSGYTDSGIVQQGVLTPGTPYMQKPFTAAGLYRKVREVLDGADGQT